MLFKASKSKFPIKTKKFRNWKQNYHIATNIKRHNKNQISYNYRLIFSLRRHKSYNKTETM